MNTPLVGVAASEGSSGHGYNVGTGGISMGWPVFLGAAISASSLSNPATTNAPTTDGINVLSASEGYAAGAATFHLGVANNTVPTGAAMAVSYKAYGLVNKLILIVATRATSTDNWPAVTAGSLGQIIVPTAKGYTLSGATQSNPFSGLVLLDAVSATASTTSSATAADTRIAQTVAVRAFVRLM